MTRRFSESRNRRGRRAPVLLVPETVRERLRVYRGRTEPVLPYYESKGLLRRVDGMAEIGEVACQIDVALGGEAGGRPLDG